MNETHNSSPSSSAVEKARDDRLVDRALDYLREHRLHPVLEVLFAWLVAVVCLLYYGYSYLKGTPTDERVPIMMEARTKHQDPAPEIYQRLVDKLDQLTPSNSSWTSEQLVTLIRSDEALRRLVSKFLMTKGSEPYSLYQQLNDVRLQLMRLPSIDEGRYEYDISLILPAYRELGSHVVSTLKNAMLTCRNPSRVQVVVVDAGQCIDLDENMIRAGLNEKWGHIRLVKNTAGGGRGPTLNFGAGYASGKLFTFLHSDTLLPQDWDDKVKATLLSTDSTVITHACAFSVGHNTSKQGLDGMGYPWGIKSVYILGNLRAYLFSLPYGDHIISVPAAYFRYLGGYPPQPMMEDYEFMDVLRKRAKILPERLAIIPRPSGKCGVRRWQKYGVVYTTLVNALIVIRYVRGWTPDEIFEYYYQRPDKKKD